MAQKKRKKTCCTANGVPLAAKLARDRMLREAMHQAAHDATVHVESNIRTQRALWLSVVSIADSFHAGPERMKRYFEALDENIEDFQRMMEEVDEDYALEKLRLKAARVTGMDIQYLYTAIEGDDSE